MPQISERILGMQAKAWRDISSYATMASTKNEHQQVNVEILLTKIASLKKEISKAIESES